MDRDTAAVAVERQGHRGPRLLLGQRREQVVLARDRRATQRCDDVALLHAGLRRRPAHALDERAFDHRRALATLAARAEEATGPCCGACACCASVAVTPR